MKFLYFAHIPFVLAFALFALLFVCANWQGMKRP